MFVAGVSLLLVSLLTAAAQVKPKTATRAPATKEVTWPKWDFAFTGPSAWRQYMEHIEDNDKVADGYHEETRYFTHMPDRPKVYPTSDMTITFTTWPFSEFKAKAPSGRMLSFPLDQFMDLEQGTPETWQPQLDQIPQLEAIRYETLDGVKGVLLQRIVEPVKHRRPTDKLVLDWNGYRLSGGKLQRITAAFETTRANLPRTETILHSFKFAKGLSP